MGSRRPFSHDGKIRYSDEAVDKFILINSANGANYRWTSQYHLMNMWSFLHRCCNGTASV